MDKKIRAAFNKQFTEEKYKSYLNEFEIIGNHSLDFRIAETPIFIPKEFLEKMLDTCEYIIDFIKDTNFKSITDNSIPSKYKIPKEEHFPSMIVFDFAVCNNEQNVPEPQLIEMQGFPSLYGFQVFNDEITRNYAQVPDNYKSYLNDYHKESYIALLKEIIVGDTNKENVILLDVFPEKQKTRIDFYCIEKLLGIKTFCVTEIKSNGTELFYLRDGEKIIIKKIFNRIVFEELEKYNLANIIDFNVEYDVEWINHPNWFNRISKYTMPFLDHPNIPVTYFLQDIKQPIDLNEFVLKPLFSFAGMGVIINPSQEDIDLIDDPGNWILQKKVEYAPIVETLEDPAKAEIRIFYFWKKTWERPIAIHNLARLSKGKMIGTRYNEGKKWVGGTIAYFEQ